MPINKKVRTSRNLSPADPATLDIRKAEDFKTYYCNFAQLTFTAMDISVTVAEAANEGGRVGVTQRARIFFAPVQAKIMREMLDATIKQYEKKYGNIDVPVSAMPKFEELNDEGGEEEI
jgi:hypothetical protein